MSYCRFSDNDFRCDVYVYDDVGGGVTTHVAARRIVHDENLPASVEFGAEGWPERYQKLMDWLDTAKREKIGLPHAGESFNDPDHASAVERLLMLRNLGYNVPQYAIDALLNE